MLVALLREHPMELRADLQRFYGLNLDFMGDTFTVSHAAACVACLPPDSAVMRKRFPTETEWDTAEHLLAAIYDRINWLAWTKTKDGQKNRNRPDPLPRPEKKKPKPVGRSVEEVKRLLAQPRIAKE